MNSFNMKLSESLCIYQTLNHAVFKWKHDNFNLVYV